MTVAWLVLAVLSILVASASARYFLLSLDLAAPPPLLAVAVERKLVFLLHIAGGTIALAVGVFNFLEASRRRYIGLHRWLGRLYLAGVLIGGISGLTLASTAQGGLAGKFGFGLLAILWLVTGGFAFGCIRLGDVESHRRWMIRNFALTFGAVTLRLWLPLLIAMGNEFDDAYSAVAWLSWVPNLIIAEFFFVNRRQDRSLDVVPAQIHPAK